MEPKDCATTVEDTYDKKGGALNCGVTEVVVVSKEMVCDAVPIREIPIVTASIKEFEFPLLCLLLMEVSDDHKVKVD